MGLRLGTTRRQHKARDVPSGRQTDGYLEWRAPAKLAGRGPNLGSSTEQGYLVDPRLQH